MSAGILLCTLYTPINIFLQTSCTVGSEVITLKRAQHKIGDSFSKYIEWCFYVGVPMQPTLVFIVLLAKKGHSRPGYNARPYAQSRTDVSICNCWTCVHFTATFKSITPLVRMHKKELVRMMKGTHEKGWTWINTGAEMLCMMLNRSGSALRDELNVVLRA